MPARAVVGPLARAEVIVATGVLPLRCRNVTPVVAAEAEAATATGAVIATVIIKIVVVPLGVLRLLRIEAISGFGMATHRHNRVEEAAARRDTDEVRAAQHHVLPRSTVVENENLLLEIQIPVAAARSRPEPPEPKQHKSMAGVAVGVGGTHLRPNLKNPPANLNNWLTRPCRIKNKVIVGDQPTREAKRRPIILCTR